MAKMYYEKDCELDCLNGKKIAITGYGSAAAEAGSSGADPQRSSQTAYHIPEAKGAIGAKLAKINYVNHFFYLFFK